MGPYLSFCLSIFRARLVIVIIFRGVVLVVARSCACPVILLHNLVKPGSLLVLGHCELEHLGGFLNVRRQLPLRPGEGEDVLDKELNIHWQGILGVDVVLEKGEEVIQLLPCGAFVKEHAASLEDRSNEADAEEVVRLIKGVYASRHRRSA